MEKTTKKLVIIRGAPAAGKSTLARNLVNVFKKLGKTSLLIPDEFKWVMTAHDKRDSKDFNLAFSNYEFALKNYLKAGYSIITEDTWDKSPFFTSKIVELGERNKYIIHQFLLKGTWKTIEHQNTLRPMVIPKKQLKKQYNSIYNKKSKEEVIIHIDDKTIKQITREVLKHVRSKSQYRSLCDPVRLSS